MFSCYSQISSSPLQNLGYVLASVHSRMLKFQGFLASTTEQAPSQQYTSHLQRLSGIP